MAHQGIDLPSLWTAVAGDRPVADKHDAPGHITWGWKDGALDKKTWYYGKILRGKATMISLDIAPYFYALSENYGSPDEDYLIAYSEGRLTQASKQVYEALRENGALNTLDLRQKAKLANAKDAEFNKALEQLQRDFKILPVGVAPAGAWKYSHIYEIVTRHYPDLSEQARTIKESQARAKLLELYFNMVGAAELRDANKLFGWGNEVTKKAIAKKKTDFNPPVFALSPASKPDFQPARRLIVLVPEVMTDAALAAQKILELSNALESRIQFLGLSKDAEHEPGIRRQLVTLSAMLEGGDVSVESKIEFGGNWLNVVKSEWQNGDVIVCFAEQRSGIARKPLSQILESNLNAEIYVLVSFQPKERLQIPGWVSSALAWAGSIAIIPAFFWLQSRLTQSSQNWIHTAMLYISLIIEGGRFGHGTIFSNSRI